MERTHEESTEALCAGRESAILRRHFAGEGAHPKAVPLAEGVLRELLRVESVAELFRRARTDRLPEKKIQTGAPIPPTTSRFEVANGDPDSEPLKDLRQRSSCPEGRHADYSPRHVWAARSEWRRQVHPNANDRHAAGA